MTNDVDATVLFSGGIDSAACAHYLQKQGRAVEGLFVDHGQAARVHEAKAAAQMGNCLNISLRTIEVLGATASGPGELVGRNAFLIFAALFAIRPRVGLLGIGIHSGTPYYDCSKVFFDKMNNLVAEHTDGHICLVAPFLAWSKLEVFDYFLSAGLPLESTYSCELGTIPTCGICASCRDRKALRC